MVEPADRHAKLRARVREADPSLLDDEGDEFDAPDGRASPNAITSLEALRQRVRDPDPNVRSSAMASLLRQNHDAMLPEIMKALRHSDARVVVGAAVVLGRARVRAALPNLIAAFQTENVAIGAAVAWALGRLGDRAVVPWLQAAIEQGFAAAAACEALGRLGDARALPTLMDAFKGAPDNATKTAAARALGRLAQALPNARPEVVRLLVARQADAIPAVRLAVAVSLFELGEQAGLEDALDEATRAGRPGKRELDGGA